eukprot:CAMPEP_0115653256 /NCGR_PEP_ID=MMETSP0272-20121206/42499_1 /TAXON_ID=71861 /ORGANISM="Scrippsiella trochoidea, Strain CCMP3099" /LENGTH=790 /DNA_ID=CAMNT_0003091103 /DNA_START=62 /DNA_END=2433 /DNA_ORIENTATION=+
MELDEVEPVEPLVFESFYWGLISAISLNLGSVIGVTCLPGQKVRAVLMSFGGGALLFALSIELFGSVLHHSEAENTTLPVWIMEGSAVVGGLFFASLNHALNDLGADLRKPSTTKGRFARLRALLMRRLAVRLWKIPFFSVLSLDELKDLIQSAMYKERFRVGDIIISDDSGDKAIFFVLSGEVRLQIYGKEDSFFPTLRRPTSQMSMASETAPGSQDACFEFIGPGGAPRPQQTLEVPPHEWLLGPNQIFGDMTVLTGSYLRCVAVANKPTKLLVLPGHEVARLLEVNSAVRDQVSMRAVERLKQVAELQHLPDHSLASLSARCTLVRYQKGDVVFNGAVNEHTPIICLVLGSIEMSYQESGKRRVVHASRLFCAEHLRSGRVGRHFRAKALEPSSALIISRTDINIVMAQGGTTLYMEDLHDEAPEHEIPGSCMTLPGQVEEPSPQHSPSDRTDTGETKEDFQRRKPRSWSHLGWDDPEDSSSDEESLKIPKLGLSAALPIGQVTDMDLAEQEMDLMDLAGNSSRRSSSKRSCVPDSEKDNMSLGLPTPSSASRAVRQAEADFAGGPAKKLATLVAASPSSAVVGKMSPTTSDDHSHGHSHGHGHSHHLVNNAAKHRAVMVWLGILIDAVPESLVIGIIINKSAVGGDDADQSRRAAAAALPFVMGVFISNLPEAMSSSGSMKAHGMKVRSILLMWLATTALTAAGSALGAVVLFPPGAALSASTSEAALTIVAVEGLAAGAMLTMIAQTMMPEAFEQGGDVVGLSCLAGFLCALSVKLIPLGDAGGH